MWDSVRTSFFNFSVRLEGNVPFMYQDTEGKVTIGIGNLIDSEQAALGLSAYGAHFFHKEAAGVTPAVLASDAEVVAEWHTIKDNPGLATGGWRAAEPLTNLRLTDDGISQLVSARVSEMERYLVNGHVPEFANFQNWPADAQLGLLSMSWAMGEAFADGARWPNFRASCASAGSGAWQAWVEAAKNCNMSNAWLAKRNAVNRGLFRNAAFTASQTSPDPGELVLPIPGDRPTLRLGAQDSDGNSDVNQLQTLLSWLGYSVNVSGVFDQATDTAVRAFQTDESNLSGASGFTADGVVGPLTWAALGFGVPLA